MPWIPSWISFQVFFLFEMATLTQKSEPGNHNCESNRKSRTASWASVDETLLAGGLRVGFDDPIAERTTTQTRVRTQMKANSSLVSGFDVSTENQADFKRVRD
jgi:hypothetical protein